MHEVIGKRYVRSLKEITNSGTFINQIVKGISRPHKQNRGKFNAILFLNQQQSYLRCTSHLLSGNEDNCPSHLLS